MRAPLWRASMLLLGASFIAYLLNRFGTSNVLFAIEMVGWRLTLIIALEALMHVANARAWWHLFPTPARRGSFARIWLVHLAGTALNEVTPGAPIGGDPVKVVALKEQFMMPLTAATLLSSKLAQALARVLFVMLGLLVVAWAMNIERFPLKGLGIGFLLTTGGLATFTALQLRGLSKPAIRLLRKVRFPDEWVERIGQLLEHVDKHLSELYGTRLVDFIFSLTLALGAVSVEVLQIWLIMGWIGHPCDWLASLAIGSFSVLLGLVLFVVPGSLGVQESGKVLIFAALGLPLSAGFSLGIILRLCSLVNLAVGFALLACLKRRGHVSALRNHR